MEKYKTHGWVVKRKLR